MLLASAGGCRGIFSPLPVAVIAVFRFGGRDVGLLPSRYRLLPTDIWAYPVWDRQNHLLPLFLLFNAGDVIWVVPF